MPAVPNNYHDWSVQEAKQNLDSVGLQLGSVPNARSTDPTPIPDGENAVTIRENADWCRMGAEMNPGAMVGVVLYSGTD